MTEIHNIVKAYRDYRDSLNKTESEIEQELLYTKIDDISELIYELLNNKELPF